MLPDNEKKPQEQPKPIPAENQPKAEKPGLKESIRDHNQKINSNEPVKK